MSEATYAVRDKREPKCGYEIREMADGTWFTTNMGLFLKVKHDLVVGGETGKRMPFNEEHIGQPVEVEVHITRDIV